LNTSGRAQIGRFAARHSRTLSSGERIRDYEDFQLRIERNGPHHYRVFASTSDGRTARSDFQLPLSDGELDAFVGRLNQAIGLSDPAPTSMNDLERIGSTLFKALFNGDVAEVYHETKGGADIAQRGLRITLVLSDTPELMRLPWEFLFRAPRFLAQSATTPVARSLDLPSARRPLKADLPIKVLGVVSSPAGYLKLDTDEERRRLDTALADLKAAGLVHLEWLDQPTRIALERRIAQQDDIHVIHFIGHGSYSSDTELGTLVLEDGDGGPAEVSGTELGTLLQDEKSLRLVVLNSCEGARVSHVDPFSGVATGLLEFDIPAVVGMQFQISDAAAIAFSDALYTELANGVPVDAAMARARRAIRGVEFGTPVLFLRATDAQLFDLPTPSTARRCLRLTAEVIHKWHKPVAVLAVVLALALALLPWRELTGTTLQGRAVSLYADPFKVGGLDVRDGPSELRKDAPGPTRQVAGSDGGSDDELAAQAISDIEEFWNGAYSTLHEGDFRPVDGLLSFDSLARTEPPTLFCGADTYDLPNAAYCEESDTIGWDRGDLIPDLRNKFGDMSIVTALAHEYGHVVQFRAGLVTPDTSVLAMEQQADCFLGSYMWWVADHQSKRVTLSTGDGVNRVLANMIALRDPSGLSDPSGWLSHGSAFERVSAFQFGFTEGIETCLAINEDEIQQRHIDLPSLSSTDADSEVPIDEETVTTLIDTLNEAFSLRQKPSVTFDRTTCPNVPSTPPASYCPPTKVISVDMIKLQDAARPPAPGAMALASGSYTATTMVVSRFMLAFQDIGGGVAIDDIAAARRTACLTGVATTKLSRVKTRDGRTFPLTTEGLDQAVSGMLTNELAASNVKGESVPAGFARIEAFRIGVLSDVGKCFALFP
jgi:predicted metalloprotease